MFQVDIYNLGYIDESQYTIVILATRVAGKWVFCKHRERDTWELPGGHIEEGEDWLSAAKRELYEESGIREAKITPICIYKLSTYGLLCLAEADGIGTLPEYEMEKIKLFSRLPKNLTYPDSHRILFNKVKEYIKNKK